MKKPILIIISVFLLLICNLQAGGKHDRAYVDEIIRSGKNVLHRLEKIAYNKYLQDDALHSALSAIIKIHFEKKHYQKCLNTCWTFLSRFRPQTHCGTLEKYILIGDCYRKLKNEPAARIAYLHVFYHFNDYDYEYSGMRKKLKNRLKLRIRKIKWDGKPYDIPAFKTAKEQLAFASRAEENVSTKKKVVFYTLGKLKNTKRCFPESEAYNIGIIVTAYRAVLDFFPENKKIANKARKGLEKNISRQQTLVTALDATIQDKKTEEGIRYESVDWLGLIGGDMVVTPLRKAQRLGSSAFDDHDIVGKVMRKLGIK